MISSASQSSPGIRQPWLKRLLLLATILLPWSWLFGPSLFTDQTPAFRDAAHFHYPTFHWVAEQWQKKQIPLWNPQENLGSPTMSDLSSSLFYPLKIIFQLPLPYPALYSWYIALHVLLAAYGTYRLSRYWQVSCWGASLATVSYTLGGSLLSQHANVIYLVSAAWFPFALQSTDRMLVKRNWRSAVTLAFLLTLMTLGGDPQSAYNAGLLAGVYALVLARKQGQSAETAQIRTRWFQHRFILLTLAGGLTVLLSAIQVLPTWQWTRQSRRAAYTQPHSLYEIPATWKRPDDVSTRKQAGQQPPGVTGILGTPAKQTHHRHIYHFSVGPWRFAELLWPNISGRMYPVHRRWIDQFPGEGRIWSPTLYLGCLPFLLACMAWSLRTSDPTVRWLSYLALFGILASLGWFGLGWLIYEIQSLVQGHSAANPTIGQPVGGLYWLLVQALPGYVKFRYPAKWFIVASLALSLLAGKQLDLLVNQPVSNRLRRLFAFTAIISGLALAGVLILSPQLLHQLEKTSAHSYWGPIEAPLAMQDILVALIQTTLLSLGCCWLLSQSRPSDNRWTVPALVCLTAAEITLANSWLVLTSSNDQWQAAPAIESQFPGAHSPGKPPTRIFRSRHGTLIPKHWSATSSWLRHEEIISWDRNTLLPRHHLLSSHALVESPGSIQSADYRSLWEVARTSRVIGNTDNAEQMLLSLLGVNYLITKSPTPKSSEARADIQFQQLKNRFPRSWISHKLVHFSPIKSSSPDDLRARTEDVFFPSGKARDLRTSAVVESAEKPVLPQLPATDAPTMESCQIVDYQDQEVTIEARLTSPGMVILSDTYTKNWRATVAVKKGNDYRAPEVVPIYRTNRVMRGIYLPAGSYQITFRYHPSLFWIGSILTMLTCLGCVAALLLLRERLSTTL